MPTRTSSQTGPWSQSSTWGGSAAPGVGDIAVISSGHTVTVDTTVDVGDDVGIGITAIGNLVVNNPLTVRVSTNPIAISQRRSSTITFNNGGGNTGGLTLNPASGVTPHWDTPNTGSGTPSIVLAGSVGNRVPITTSLARGGNRGYFDFTAWAPTLNWDYVDLQQWGGTGTGTTTNTLALAYVGLPGSVVNIDFLRTSNNVGKFYFNMGSETDFTLDVRNCDFRSPRSTSWMEIRNSAAATSGIRQFKDCTWHPGSTRTSVTYWTVGFAFDGIVASNTGFSGDIQDASNTFKRFAFLNNETSSSAWIAGRGANSLVIEDGLFLAYRDNPHYIGISSDSGTGDVPVVRRNIVDGGAYPSITDDGDFVLPANVITIERNLLINKAGTVLTAGQTTGVATVRRNTLYDAGKGATIGESIGAATQLARFSSNLIVNMNSGLLQDSSFVQQTNLNLDYNACYTMATSGNFDIGANNGYLGAATFAAWRSGTYGVTDDYGLHDVYADPQFVAPSRTAVTYYDSVFGSGGSFANVLAEMLKLNGTDSSGADASFNTAMSVGKLRGYLIEGFTPTNTVLKAAGDPDDGAPTIGAIDFSPALRYVLPVSGHPKISLAPRS